MQPFRILQDQLSGMLRGLVELVPNIVAAVAVVVLTWLVAFAIVRAVRLTLRRSHARPSLLTALVSIVRIGVWVVGLLVAMTVLFPGLTPAKLLAGLGLGSIAIGLAFKDIFENYIAGLLILLRKPMRIGDDIECEGVSGRVEEITIRDTYVRKRSNELILMPNSMIYKNPTTVLTDRPERRVELVVGIAYDEDVGAGREVIRRAVEGIDGIEKDRGVDVFAREFNSSSIDFLVRWWTKSAPPDAHRSRDEAVAAIKRALDDAGIEIPFPYRTLTFKEPLRLSRSEGRDDGGEQAGA